jgi:hypothetical protein
LVRHPFSLLFNPAVSGRIPSMLRLTRQERKVLCVVLFLLLTGWLVKVWRATEPQAAAVEMTEPNPNAYRSF